MSTAAKQTRENRTITVDFRDDATYLQLLGDGKAFVEFVCAFLLSLGFQLAHKATCHGGGCLTRHSHYVRLRVRGITIWRIQCTTCKAVFTVLPHFVLRYRQIRPEVARDALLATHGGLSLECCAVLYHNPSCDLLDIHELLRSHEGWQASAPTEEEAHGRENYNDILSM